MEQKMKHLEMIQGIITRMANNSFLIKGWAITLISAVMALGANESDGNIVYIAFLILTMSWILDSYFLRQERLYRKLYDKVRNTDPKDIDFSMKILDFINQKDVKRFSVFRSETMLVFYGTLIFALLAIAYFLELICM